MPTLSVCIPTWNGARLLPRTLASLAAQTLEDLEILVGDDASADDTCGVAGRFPDPRIRVVSFRPRAGIAGNWTRTMRQARGEFVAVVGQDDEWDPGWAAALVSLLRVHPEADLCFCRRRISLDDEASRQALGAFFAGDYPRLMAPFHERAGEVIPPEVMAAEAAAHNFELNLVGEPSFAIFRRSSPPWREGFQARLPQLLDWEFHTRFFRDKPLLFCREELGTYHLHGAAASVANSRRDYFGELAHLQEVALARFGPRLEAEALARLGRRLAEVRELARP